MGQENAKTGLPLIELFIVVALLGIVGVTLVPQLMAASNDARQAAVLDDLAMMRRQIQRYKNQHDRWPASGTDSAEQFVMHLTKRTNQAGHEVSTGRFGPYLIGEVPTNSITQRNGVLVVPGELKAHQYGGHGKHGWTYSSTTGEFRANLSPNVLDREGHPLNQR